MKIYSVSAIQVQRHKPCTCPPTNGAERWWCSRWLSNWRQFVIDAVVDDSTQNRPEQQTDGVAREHPRHCGRVYVKETFQMLPSIGGAIDLVYIWLQCRSIGGWIRRCPLMGQVLGCITNLCVRSMPGFPTNLAVWLDKTFPFRTVPP